MITVMGQLSCYTGKEITWDAINKSEFLYEPAPGNCRDGMESPIQPGSDGKYPVPVPGKTQLDRFTVARA